MKFIYKNNPLLTAKKYQYKKASNNENDSKYSKFIKNLEENGIGVNKISETTSAIGIELTQFVHPNLGLIEEIITSAATDAGINKNIKKDLKVADLTAVSEINSDFKNNSNLVYERKKARSFNTSTGIKFRPFLASREEFFKGALLVENDSEYVLLDNLIFISNLKYSFIRDAAFSLSWSFLLGINSSLNLLLIVKPFIILNLSLLSLSLVIV